MNPLAKLTSKLQQRARIRPQQHINHQIGEIQLTCNLQRQQALTVQGTEGARFSNNQVLQENLQLLRTELANEQLEFLVVILIREYRVSEN